MTVKGVGKSLKSTFQEAVDSVKTSVKDVKLSEIIVPEVKTPAKVKEIFKRKEKPSEPKQSEIQEPKIISTRSAIKTIYFLMSADGEKYHSEEDKFDAICTEFDPGFAQNREQIISECEYQLNKVIDSEDFYDVIQDGVENALTASVKVKTTDSYITPKLLVWNLLTIAYSDESYNETERKLLKYIVRKLNIDKDVFLEMENSYLSLMDLEKELNWIKSTDRPYLTIESMVNEIADRKNVIFESVKNLISL